MPLVLLHIRYIFKMNSHAQFSIFNSFGSRGEEWKSILSIALAAFKDHLHVSVYAPAFQCNSELMFICFEVWLSFNARHTKRIDQSVVRFFCRSIAIFAWLFVCSSVPYFALVYSILFDFFAQFSEIMEHDCINYVSFYYVFFCMRQVMDLNKKKKYQS